MKNPNFIFFDFDGVIVDSSKIKHDGFIDIVSQLAPHYAPAFKDELITNLVGCERSAVADWLEQKAQINKVIFLNLFKEYLDQNELNIALVPGIRNYLEYLFVNKAHVFIVSAAPNKDIVKILKKFDIDPSSFSKICGSDLGSKKDSIEIIFQTFNINPLSSVFFGDMPSDFEVSEFFNIFFIRVKSFVGNLCQWPSSKESKIIDDFRNFYTWDFL